MTTMPLDRRRFLTAAAAAGLAPLLPIRRGWAARSTAPGPRLVVVILRGAADALNIVVPYREAAYYGNRPRIAVAAPGDPKGAIDLDGHFGLHPALAPIMPLWQGKSLAFVHACGSPDPTRSHFDAQTYLENGTPGQKATSEGWMARLLETLPGPAGPMDAISVGRIIPLILTGSRPIGTLAPGAQDAEPAKAADAFDRLYAGDDPVSRAYREARGMQAALATMDDAADAERRMADHGAPQPSDFGRSAEALAHLMAQDPSVRLGFLQVAGWDTHANQGGASGVLATHLRFVADGLMSLVQGLGRFYADTVILVMSEFGRRLHENVAGGTDHGRASVAWVMGGPIAGGHVLGDWPGLAPDKLTEGLDLAVTTDYRAVAGLLVAHHFRLPDSALARIFPGAPSASPELGRLIAA